MNDVTIKTYLTYLPCVCLSPFRLPFTVLNNSTAPAIPYIPSLYILLGNIIECICALLYYTQVSNNNN